MENTFIQLIEKFKNIKNRNWIIVPRRGYGENGLLFENLLGLKNNEFSIADYNGVEIKVQNIRSKYPITLFSLSLDGPEPFAIQQFVQRYGVYDTYFKDSKIMYIKLNSLDYSSWGRFLKMKLYCDKKNKKLFIIVSHSNGKIIEKRAFWSFDSLQNVIYRKLSFLCIVNNSCKFFNGVKYIKYNDIHFYKLISFENFIDAISNGRVYVQIKYGIYKFGNRAGKPYNHGIAFQINYDDLNSFFEEIYYKKNST